MELPKYLIIENLKDLISKKFKSPFQVWLDYLSNLGYEYYYQVMSTKDYDILQNRERVFMVSILDSNIDFTFPQKKN